MNEKEQRTYEVVRDLDSLLHTLHARILKNEPLGKDYKKVSHALKWINENLNKEEFLNFLEEQHDFLYEDIILKLLEDPTFDPKKYN